MEELYDYLLKELELVGVLKLERNHILYYRYDLSNDVDEFYQECIEEKNLIKDKLPNGFKLDNFNYEQDYISFKIKR